MERRARDGTRPIRLAIRIATLLAVAAETACRPPGPAGDDALASADVLEIALTDADVLDIATPGPIVSCQELFRAFDCPTASPPCPPVYSQTDYGPCDTPRAYCEDWSNCHGGGGLRDWDCLCRQTSTGDWRWWCTIESVCARDAGDAGAFDVNGDVAEAFDAASSDAATSE